MFALVNAFLWILILRRIVNAVQNRRHGPLCQDCARRGFGVQVDALESRLIAVLKRCEADADQLSASILRERALFESVDSSLHSAQEVDSVAVGQLQSVAAKMRAILAGKRAALSKTRRLEAECKAERSRLEAIRATMVAFQDLAHL